MAFSDPFSLSESKKKSRRNNSLKMEPHGQARGPFANPYFVDRISPIDCGGSVQHSLIPRHPAEAENLCSHSSSAMGRGFLRRPIKKSPSLRWAFSLKFTTYYFGPKTLYFLSFLISVFTG